MHRPVGGHIGQVAFPRQAPRERRADGGHVLVVHGAVAGGHQQHHVGVAGVEAVLEGVGGLGGLGGGIVEPAGLELGHGAATYHPGDDDGGQGGHQHEDPAPQQEPGETIEHGGTSYRC